MNIALVPSPWKKELQALAGTVRQRMLLATPYVTAEGFETLVQAFTDVADRSIALVTCLNPKSVATGSLDIAHLADASRRLPRFRVHHLARLHAKVYIADGKQAIVTSGNLTGSSLAQNHEYGLRVTDKSVVEQIERDLLDYTALGSEVSPGILAELAALSEPLSETSPPTAAAERYLHRLRELRGDQGYSRSAVLSQTIRYLLRRRPLRTTELHPLIQSIHPDLCDDAEDRIISGVHFGKRWKHDVRNAQQSLRRRGLIELGPGECWRVTGSASR